ncbi:MAG TPA: hypothetical protein VF691_11805 [Cytophagaceae bacterium]|jgi:hypothetical protein
MNTSIERLNFGNKRFLLLLIAIFVFPFFAFGQTPADTAQIKKEHSFPEIKGYVGIVHPLRTWSKDGNTYNFEKFYTFGNPWGINVWKSKKIGFSLEFTPFIRSDEKGVRMSNFLFHPGLLYRLGREFTLIGRLAYETSGRFGFTPILNKVVYRNKDYSIFVAGLLPVRYGNVHAPSYTVAFQFGLGF